MHDTLRFWLDRGVDGFRMDVVHLIGKDARHATTRPRPSQPNTATSRSTTSPARTTDLRRIRGVLDEYPGDRTSVGEVYLLDEAAMAELLRRRRRAAPELQLPLPVGRRSTPAELRRRIATTLSHSRRQRGAWPTWVLSNHDVARHRHRYGGSEDARPGGGRAAAHACRARRSSTRARSSGSSTPTSPPTGSSTPAGATAAGRRSRGLRDDRHGWPADAVAAVPARVRRAQRRQAQRATPDSILHLYRRMLTLRQQSPALHRWSSRAARRPRRRARLRARRRRRAAVRCSSTPPSNRAAIAVAESSERGPRDPRGDPHRASTARWPRARR